jgi:hypothetical protein
MRNRKRILKFLLVFFLIFSWIFSSWPQIFHFPPKIDKVKAATALTAYLSSSAATTITTANQILTTAPASETSKTTKIGKTTGYCELYAQGNSGGCTGVSSPPAPSGHGFILDATTLEGQQILSGNWTGAMKLAVSKSGVTVTAYMRVFKYSGGTYTQIATSTSNSIALGTTATALTFSAGSGALTNFNTGDKLYIDFVVNITSNTANSTTETISLYENGGAAEEMTTPGYQPQPVTTLGDGTNPSNITIGPGSAATPVDAFTFQTNVGTDSITAVTVGLAAGTHAYLSNVAITSDDGATVYGSSTNPSSDSFSISLTGLTASTTLTQYKITITPLSATAMPAPPGGTYTVTSTITGWTGTNTQAGSDPTSAVVTIDNQSPSDVTGASGTAGNTQVALSWTNPSDSDLNGILVLRSTSTVVATPTEGLVYTTSTAIGASVVACVVSAPGSSCVDTGLTNGTSYYYKIFTYDNYENYSTPGVVPTGSPFTPQASTVSCDISATSTSFGNIDAKSVYTSSPNITVSSTCSYSLGCTIQINDAGNGSSAGLYKSTSPTHLILSANATLAAGSEGYGIQATTTANGSGGTLAVNPTYNVTGNTVGGLTVSAVTLASSSASYTARNAVITHKTSLTNTSYAGSYSDTITYSCVGN